MPRIIIQRDADWYRRYGVIGPTERIPFAGGIFGNPKLPSNQHGIFTARYALPASVNRTAVTGGKLSPRNYKYIPGTALDIEKRIKPEDELPGEPGGGMGTMPEKGSSSSTKAGPGATSVKGGGNEKGEGLLDGTDLGFLIMVLGIAGAAWWAFSEAPKKGQ